MSRRYGIEIPSPDEINYHEARQAERVEAARKLVEVGDVLSIIDGRIAAESDPVRHPLYKMVAWHLEMCLTPLDGAEFFDTFRQLVLCAIDTAIDDVLETTED
jgi:hypothetical protein